MITIIRLPDYNRNHESVIAIISIMISPNYGIEIDAFPDFGRSREGELK